MQKDYLYKKKVKKLGDLAGLFENLKVEDMKELDAITHEYFAGMIE